MSVNVARRNNLSGFSQPLSAKMASEMSNAIRRQNGTTGVNYGPNMETKYSGRQHDDWMYPTVRHINIDFQSDGQSSPPPLRVSRKGNGLTSQVGRRVHSASTSRNKSTKPDFSRKENLIDLTYRDLSNKLQAASSGLGNLFDFHSGRAIQNTCLDFLGHHCEEPYEVKVHAQTLPRNVKIPIQKDKRQVQRARSLPVITLNQDNRIVIPDDGKLLRTVRRNNGTPRVLDQNVSSLTDSVVFVDCEPDSFSSKPQKSILKNSSSTYSPEEDRNSVEVCTWTLPGRNDVGSFTVRPYSSSSESRHRSPMNTVSGYSITKAVVPSQCWNGQPKLFSNSHRTDTRSGPGSPRCVRFKALDDVKEFVPSEPVAV